MTHPVHEPPTVLDPGRRRPAAAEVTELDPGRSRPRNDGTAFTGTLPPQLDARFTVVRVLSITSGEADVLLVRERVTDEERVLKLYRYTGRDQNVREFLTHKASRHTVRVFEVGADADRDYEIMEYLAGDSLVEFRATRPAGLDTHTLTDIVQQVADGLTEIHDAGITHRDVKPANVLVRTLSPFDVALADFGISVYQPEPASITDTSGTVRYMSPEFIAGGLVSSAYDWWSLGVTVLELATGSPLLAGLDDNDVRIYVTGGPINVQQVVDDRIRLLCKGLLAQDVGQRWGAAEVGRWLDGESPPVPGYTSVPGASEAEVPEPYVYADTEYRNRALLAAAMTSTWETAVAVLYGDDREPLERLEQWLRQYGPSNDGRRDNRKDPADVRLLRLLRRIAPTHPPIYRQINITWSQLRTLARAAVAGDGDLPEIVDELWTYQLLPLLSHGRPEPGLGGGDSLDTAHVSWSDRWQRWKALVSSVSDADARARLNLRVPEMRRRTLAACLWAAVEDDAGRTEIRRNLLARERAVRLPWFSDLVRSPDGMWAAVLLSDYAEDCAEQRDERDRAEAERRRWLSRNRRFREWSRRQNRPLALSWAVAGVFVLGVFCALLISLSDVAGRVPNSTIVDAWVATVFAITSTLTFESVLAWEIGGRFHPRYSILGAGFIALGRAARSIRGRGIALGVVVGVLGGTYILTVLAPVVTPLVIGGAVIIWTVVRYVDWCVEREREQADAERGARELLAAVRL
ncbi:MAG TPA: serine/threonine-protein kinase [Pseudonocardiaceae bacterium]|jgi:serine/threonine protein kinase|nr:serine/threonine-protein kinase [Pseudonocardiaceae bacterium]